MDCHDLGLALGLFLFCYSGLIIAVLWYLLVRTRPSESPFVSKAELETITAGQATPDARRENIVISPGFSRLDRLIRVRDLSPISTVKGLFTSKNILGDCVAYFMMVSVLYGLLTWIPLYLVKEKGFTFMMHGPRREYAVYRRFYRRDFWRLCLR